VSNQERNAGSEVSNQERNAGSEVSNQQAAEWKNIAAGAGVPLLQQWRWSKEHLILMNAVGSKTLERRSTKSADAPRTPFGLGGRRHDRFVMVIARRFSGIGTSLERDWRDAQEEGTSSGSGTSLERGGRDEQEERKSEVLHVVLTRGSGSYVAAEDTTGVPVH
jgi:hypothetical protein